ncbi:MULTISPECIES: MarR family transcriptional regulator [unclassified Pseudomonas]|uniref:MarR family winged helix-turn-helix transcriptional regulator n=1 Tax=unclassified Pseudomonas TaxID=196821 RepID=UPI002B23C047|nr:MULTISPECIES: MarR family transcriptional regulator [unclassified Pseudomonas]MEA9977231.1 MarR family transcriptional regulator [Pseudomonas sp. RTS4]MEB0198276.1 MarR family transcriptional regulator [Pseudomonas sp. 5S4]MEB0247130.1 MarR family transcriptional regulator [Pseudomonas sp. 10S5]
MKHFTPENFHAGLMGLLIGRVDGLKNRILDTHLVPYGVTSSQFKVLIIVGQYQSDTPVELCRHLSLDSGSMTRMIDRLVQKGLLVRDRSETDRRQVKLALTEEGQKLSERLPQIGAEAMNDLFGALDSAQVKSLEQILTKVLVAADDQITIARLGFNKAGKQ